ncbi:alginate O-acetyltransferase AlgX-related protein [Solimonas terrae]|uniref:Alginate biosynthesis protein AlgX n=1 Tax=Solimonas terrae TaxID=1396819 RepID=A0A6M2BPV7_9GAMM|nr:alginate biosynthesis protein AlgX [Solimonas terrae]NGY04642.1 alginate O-acetyltransferase [Solimonas terrae]
MGRQLNAVARCLRAPLLVAALVAALGIATPRPAAADDGDAPRYDIQLCCQLCPKAADPAAYDGSSYLEDFRVLEQGRDDWLFRSGIDLTTDIEISDASIAQLHRLAAALRARGSELVIVLQPPRGLMDVDKLTDAERKHYDFAAAKKSYAHALQRIRSAGVAVAPIDRLVDEHKGYEYFFRRDHHWTPDGARHTAAVVADTVRALPAFEDVPRKTFVTHTASLIGKPGTLQKVATQICGGSYSMQYVSGDITEPADGGDANALLGDAGAAAGDDASGGGLLDVADRHDDGGGLLGDAGDDGEVPQIVLIGTSNSDTKGGYNFNGYLEQDLGADILDTALSGGSFDGSLLHYLPSALYQKHPPKIIVWEIPWQNWPGASKNPYKTYRQAVPLVHDGCEGRPAVLSNTIDLKAGSNELLFNGGGAAQPLVGARYWLDLQFDDPTVKDLHAVIWYFSGQKESLKMHFNQYVDNGGRFVTELRNNRPDYAKATFMGATVEMDQPPAKPLHLTARICEAEGAPGQQTAALEQDDGHD